MRFTRHPNPHYSFILISEVSLTGKGAVAERLEILFLDDCVSVCLR